MNVCNIIPTTAAEHIAKKLEDGRGLKIIFPDKNKEGSRYFPDGEVYTRLSKINEINGRTVVLHSGAPNPDKGLIELEILLEIISRDSVRPIEVFFTYFPYARQDNVWKIGETNTARNLIEKLVNYYNVEKIYIIDAHFSHREWVKNYPIVNVSAVDLLKNSALAKYPEIIFLAPDIGSQKRTGLKGTEKKRKDSHNVEIKEITENVSDKTVGVVDDMIGTGNTLVDFYDECRSAGVKKVVAAATHGVIPSGAEKVFQKYDGFYLTNTVDNPRANIDISGLVARAIRDYK
ncbi:ribose-phosphate pyrophosphokinase [Candidatus Parcubacteria bacterium]|nr:ribose-phosphate pyrophosphokinase [Candidatus Parcubacteria bacterium]